MGSLLCVMHQKCSCQFLIVFLSFVFFKKIFLYLYTQPLSAFLPSPSSAILLSSTVKGLWVTNSTPQGILLSLAMTSFWLCQAMLILFSSGRRLAKFCQRTMNNFHDRFMPSSVHRCQHWAFSCCRVTKACVGLAQPTFIWHMQIWDASVLSTPDNYLA